MITIFSLVMHVFKSIIDQHKFIYASKENDSRMFKRRVSLLKFTKE